MESNNQMTMNNKENVEITNKVDQNFFNTKKFFWISVCVLLFVSLISILPFGLSCSQAGHDIWYHSATIDAVNDAWKNGNFGTRIYGLICQDYGYGNGLFYTMLPVGMIVVFMNLFHMSASWAICLMLIIISALSGMVVLAFVKKVFKSNLIAAICALFYILFPYFMSDIYVRMSLSEIFLMLAIPMIALGIYDLIENANYKSFMFFFTVGVALAILTHLATTIYIGVVVLIYLILNWKKFISNYKFVPFLISCFIILCLTAVLYIPILINFGMVQTNKMNYGGFSLWESAAHVLSQSYLVLAAVVTMIITTSFVITYFAKDKTLRTKQEKSFLILSLISVSLVTPFYPWFLMWGPFSMLQFAWRLFSIVALIDALMLAYLIKNIKLKSCLIGLAVCVSLCFVAHYESMMSNFWDYSKDTINNMVATDTYLPYSVGQGAFGGDYHPVNANNDYIFVRANDKMVLNSTSKVEQLANYQTVNMMSFVVNCENEETVVLNIPYSVCDNIKIEQKQTDYPREVVQIEAVRVMVDGQEMLQLNLQRVGESKIIIRYEENSAFDRYLKANPFEFVVREGEATFTNFNKNNSSSYSVEVNVTNKAVVELPTLYYKGYKITLTNVNGTETINPVLNDNGFVQVTLTQGGTLHVEFAPGYVTFANVLSIIGLVLFAITMLVCLIVPRQKFANLANKTTEFFKTHKNVGEILRFIIVGGIATLIDMFTMGVVMYLMQKSIYTGFLNVFIGAPTPSTLATIVGTSVGFLVGLVVNYILSIAFVFNEKGNSKSAKGFVVFTALSVIGLGINILGTYIGFDLLKLNQWLVKIIMILVVLVYNYISKKLVLFKNKKPKDENIKPRNDKTKQK